MRRQTKLGCRSISYPVVLEQVRQGKPIESTAAGRDNSISARERLRWWLSLPTRPGWGTLRSWDDLNRGYLYGYARIQLEGISLQCALAEPCKRFPGNSETKCVADGWWHLLRRQSVTKSRKLASLGTEVLPKIMGAWARASSRADLVPLFCFIVR